MGFHRVRRRRRLTGHLVDLRRKIVWRAWLGHAGRFAAVHETVDEITVLQDLLDLSAAGAGSHLRGIFTDGLRPDAVEVCARMTGMRLLTVATVTADGRPVSGPLDGYLLHGVLWASSSPNSVRIRHLRARPAISATYLPDESFALIVHGHATLFDFHSDEASELRSAMIEHYVPLQGPTFADWVDELDGVAVRIDAERLFAFRNDGATQP